MTDDEKRAAAGYGPKENSSFAPSDSPPSGPPLGATAAKFNPNHDEAGRFTFADGGGGTAGNDTLVGGAGTDQLAASKLQAIYEMLKLLAKPLMKAPKLLRPAEKPLHDLLKPGGKELGSKFRSAGDGIRTLEKEEFGKLKSELIDGAVEVPAQQGYEGKVYRRPENSEFGIRSSEKYGESIDVMKTSDGSVLPNGYKIHSK